MAYQQVTLAQLRSQLISRLGQPAGTFYTTPELNLYLQESLRVWNSLTGYWRGSQTLTTTPNNAWYVINGTLFSTLRVTWQGIPLTPATLYDLDTGRQFWQSETIASGGDVPLIPQLYAVGASNLIAIWPSDTSATNALIIEGVLSTPLLVNDGDFVNIGQEELCLILDYSEHLALFKEGGAEWESSLPLFQNFLAGAIQRNGMLQKSALYRKYLGGDEADVEKNPIRRYGHAGVR